MWLHLLPEPGELMFVKGMFSFDAGTLIVLPTQAGYFAGLRTRLRGGGLAGSITGGTAGRRAGGWCIGDLRHVWQEWPD